MDKIIAQRILSKPISGWGKDATITATAKLYSLNNQEPYFSVTAVIARPGRRDCEACGCLHDEIAKAFPDMVWAIKLHLSSADGVPMHAEANGWWWMEHALGLREPSKYDRVATPEKALEIWADIVRVSIEDAQQMRDTLKANGSAARAVHADYIEGCKPRWQREAIEVLAFLNA